ncbi:Uncharacterised protein [Vibrio cholerae]|nr:Uncharacterised protein [Vibrio cholerae]
MGCNWCSSNACNPWASTLLVSMCAPIAEISATIRPETFACG